MVSAVLIDYGSGNLRSVAKALERVGAQVRAVATPEEIDSAAQLLVLPGVGSFGDCVAQLHQRRLWNPVAAWLAAQRPFLGICLGYQLLFESSEESPGVAGFGVLRGAVRKFNPARVKVPQIGWNEIAPTEPTAPLWRGLGAAPHMYFVHSYFPQPVDASAVAAHCDYGGKFAAAVSGPGPLLATQFHPEKSQAAGLALLENFLATIQRT